MIGSPRIYKYPRPPLFFLFFLFSLGPLGYIQGYYFAAVSWSEQGTEGKEEEGSSTTCFPATHRLLACRHPHTNRTEPNESNMRNMEKGWYFDTRAGSGSPDSKGWKGRILDWRTTPGGRDLTHRSDRGSTYDTEDDTRRAPAALTRRGGRGAYTTGGRRWLKTAHDQERVGGKYSLETFPCIAAGIVASGGCVRHRGNQKQNPARRESKGAPWDDGACSCRFSDTLGIRLLKPRRYFSNGQWGLASDLLLTVVVIGGYCSQGTVVLGECLHCWRSKMNPH